ncbi:dockerin type I repeat-containing protein [Patescibacteria group bacterium]
MQKNIKNKNHRPPPTPPLVRGGANNLPPAKGGSRGVEKRGIILLLTAIFVVSGIFGGLLKTKKVNAQNFIDTAALQQRERDYQTHLAEEAADKAKELKWKAFKTATYNIIVSMANNFTQSLAYNSAVFIAEGGKGRQGLGWSESWSKYLNDAKDAALGDFIGSISQVWGVDFCDPGALEKIDITFGLIASIQKPPKPRCDWKDIKNSWDKLDDNDFTTKLGFMFNPKVNYLGSSFALKSEMEQSAKDNENLAKMVRGIPTETGFKSINDTVSGYIQTPDSIIKEMAWYPADEAARNRQTEGIGNALMADLVVPTFKTFFSTLTGKLMEKWANKGMFQKSSGSRSITDPESSATLVASQNDTKAMYGDLMESEFGAGGNYDILSDFVSCPVMPQNLKNGPTNCVIDNGFRMAIEEGLTVGQAINNNYLKKDNIFGFKSDGQTPDYKEGYSLRNMIILRSYRILPVGWEIATQYIEKYIESEAYTLGEMVACYSIDDNWTGVEESWCRGMVDPSWVLKAPANNCDKMAYGQEIISKSTSKGIDMNKDGKYYNFNKDKDDPLNELDDNDSPPIMNITRNEFCAETQSCLMERDDGSCLKWGTCLEEKRIWEFEGDKCDAIYNSCMEYERIPLVSPSASRSGLTPFTKGGTNTTSSTRGGIAYLKNSLDYGVCGANNAGCSWLCQYYDKEKEEWTCGMDPASPLAFPEGYSLPAPTTGALFFDNSVQECEQADEGCHKYIRLTDGANLVFNGGFEKGAETALNLDGQPANSSVIIKFNDWPIEKSSGDNFEIEKMIDNEKGGWVYKITTNGGNNGLYFYDNSKKDLTLMPSNYRFDLYKNYVFSVDVKVISGKVEIGLTDGSARIVNGSSRIGEWERIVVELPKEEMIINKAFIHSVGGSEFYLDNVQLEEVQTDLHGLGTDGDGYAYKEYGDYSRVAYIKKAPDYLDCANNIKLFKQGVENGTLTPTELENYENILSECSNYAMECSEEQVGCQKYSPVNGDPWIPAIISEEDTCDYECVNYKSYKQSATNFSTAIMNVNFIADSPYLGSAPPPNPLLGEEGGIAPPLGGAGSGGRLCPASTSGCTEFTNLDELEQEGESKEYYSFLKRCVKPDDAGVSCGTFYTWIGSDTAGYQLKEYYLEKAGDGVREINNPQDFGECNNQQDAIDNSANCKEFYSEDGTVYYAIYQNTVTCSENCHPYRQTSDRINKSECVFYGSTWNNGLDVCNLEKENCDNSGGIWDTNEKACMYQAVPEEGIVCSVENVGCREYKGTTSANVKIILRDEFEGMDSDGWENSEQSNRSSYFTGHSITPTGANDIIKTLSGESNLQIGKEYKVSFLANYNSNNSRTVRIQLRGINFIAERTLEIKNNETDDWNIYQAGPMVLTGDLDENGALEGRDANIMNAIISNPASATAKQVELADINGDGIVNITDRDIFNNYRNNPSQVQEIVIKDVNNNLYFDNIIVKEVLENSYLIKDSWTVPEKCDEPISGFQLGCEEYKNIAGDFVQLKSFTDICPSEAVGCSRMIDTYNSDTVLKQVFNESDESQIIVPADEVVYFIDDFSKECHLEDKGCQRLGVPQFNKDRTALDVDAGGYSGDVYLINNPDNYGSILCEYEAVNCSEFEDSDGNKNYFKDPGDKVCQYANGQWLKNGTEEACPTEINFDFTIGANGIDVPMPTNGWAGLCPSSQSGCLEYIDPLSDNNPNLILNGDIEQDIDKNGRPDEWNNCLSIPFGYGDSKAISSNCNQTILFKKPGLYTLSALVRGAGILTIQGCYTSSPDNSMVIEPDGALTKANLIFFMEGANPDTPLEIRSGRFYVYEPDLECELIARSDLGIGADPTMDEISIRETGVYYNLDDTVNGCSEYSNYEGCVLVNQRNLLQTEWNENNEIKPVYNDLIYSSNLAVSGKNNITCDIQKNELANYCDDNYIDGTPAFENCAKIIAQTQKGFCSANKLIKAKQDRVCDRWLYDMTSEKITNTKGETEIKVWNVGECNALDESGQCIRKVESPKENIEFSFVNIDLMNNISGMSKVGFQWDNNHKIEGNYSISNMSQFGQMINFQGGFEMSTPVGQPVGWESEAEIEYGEAWSPIYFQVINNPVDSQLELGLDSISAPEGKNFLKINRDYKAFTKYFPAYDNMEYVISGSINSINSGANASAQIQVLVYGQNKNRLQINNHDGERIILSLDGGKQWTFLSKRFTINNSEAAFLRIELINYLGSEDDSAYFDDITILPALELRDSEDISAMAPSICKIYPQEDSLACEYVGDEGLSYRGERGYCLEYDRAPGNPDVCINWFPTNVIRGDEEIEMPLFNEGIPLFYCAEVQLLEYRKTTNAPLCVNCNNQCPVEGGYVCSGCHGDHGGGRGNGRCIPSGEIIIQDNDGDAKSGWYDYNGTIRYGEYANDTGGRTRIYSEELLARCVKIIQVAKLGGENRAWFDRMISNTDYAGVPDLMYNDENYKYNSFNSPYGAMISPDGEIIYNITELEGNEDTIDGKDALMILRTTNGEYIGMPEWGLPYSASSTHFSTAYYNVNGDDLQFIEFGVPVQNSIEGATDRLKNLFAESYLAWEWDDRLKKYLVAPEFIWGPPENICAGNRRTEAMTVTEQFCGIPPIIDNIKIGNSSGGQIEIGRNSSVLLKFTSEINKEQTPLTAYYIDWRDGTDSIAEELKVMDKPHITNPHSFSHFYSYDDVYKNRNLTGINCYDFDDPECAIYERGDCCLVKPRIRITDNWDWCSDGIDGSPCPSNNKANWDEFGGLIVVSER